MRGRCPTPISTRRNTHETKHTDKITLSTTGKITLSTGKPPFQHIRKQARTRDGQPITRQDIATLAGVSIGEVYIVDMGGYSSQQNIHKVVHAFNQLTGQRLNKHAIRRGGVIDTEGERG